MSRYIRAEPSPVPQPCPGPILDALGSGHVAGPNAKSSLTFLGLLLFWATRNAR